MASLVTFDDLASVLLTIKQTRMGAGPMFLQCHRFRPNCIAKWWFEPERETPTRRPLFWGLNRHIHPAGPKHLVLLPGSSRLHQTWHGPCLDQPPASPLGRSFMIQGQKDVYSRYHRLSKSGTDCDQGWKSLGRGQEEEEQRGTATLRLANHLPLFEEASARYSAGSLLRSVLP